MRESTTTNSLWRSCKILVLPSVLIFDDFDFFQLLFHIFTEFDCRMTSTSSLKQYLHCGQFFYIDIGLINRINACLLNTRLIGFGSSNQSHPHREFVHHKFFQDRSWYSTFRKPGTETFLPLWYMLYLILPQILASNSTVRALYFSNFSKLFHTKPFLIWPQ